MIPHVINYCWFGDGKLSDLNKKCINSWYKKCPNYKIIKWDESNYDLSKAPKFVQDAYKNKKWAFVSDYVRLDVIYQHGGVYLDTDVELIKNLDNLLEKSSAYMGFENDKYVNSGLGFGAEAHNSIIKEMLEYYDDLKFRLDNLDNLACPIINTKILKRYGLALENTLQELNGMTIYPTEYFCPKNIYTGKLHITKNTISIHQYFASWMDKKQKSRLLTIYRIKRILPSSIVNFLRNLVKKGKRYGIKKNK